jgi:hypothetical protein
MGNSSLIGSDAVHGNCDSADIIEESSFLMHSHSRLIECWASQQKRGTVDAGFQVSDPLLTHP